MSVRSYLAVDEQFRKADQPHAAAREARRVHQERERMDRETRAFAEGLIWGVIGSALAWGALVVVLWGAWL